MAESSKYNIGFIIDSSCDIPDKFILKPNVYFVPLSIFIGEKKYLDGITLSKEEFYVKLETLKETPRTTPPSPEKFLTQYKKSFEVCENLIVLTINSQLSDTYGNAQKARKKLSIELQEKIHVIDSGGVAGTVGMILNSLYESYEQNISFEKIIKNAHLYVKDVVQFAYIADSKWLQKSKKISFIKGAFANVLNFSPIIKLEYGKPNEAIRNVKKGNIRKYIEIIQKNISHKDQYDICITHIKAEKYLDDIRDFLTYAYPTSEIKYELTTGPVLGSYVGFGSINISFIKKEIAETLKTD
jgi:DegV family protein with EDD domain